MTLGIDGTGLFLSGMCVHALVTHWCQQQLLARLQQASSADSMLRSARTRSCTYVTTVTVTKLQAPAAGCTPARGRGCSTTCQCVPITCGCCRSCKNRCMHQPDCRGCRTRFSVTRRSTLSHASHSSSHSHRKVKSVPFRLSLEFHWHNNCHVRPIRLLLSCATFAKLATCRTVTGVLWAAPFGASHAGRTYAIGMAVPGTVCVIFRASPPIGFFCQG